MTFSWPIALLGLLLLPLGVLGYVLVQRRRQRYAVRFTNLDLLASVVDRAPGWRRHLPPALALLALGALVLAVAQPTMAQEVPRKEATVILTMDVSGSMQAQDVEPDRMAAAKQAAEAFLSEVPDTVRVGVVSFSTGTQVVLAPTTDHDAVRQAVQGLSPGGGTALGDAIAESASLAQSLVADGSADTQPATSEPDADAEAPAVVVLLSDGANSSGTLEPEEAAARAASAGVPVYTIALGTDQGTVTIDPGDGTGPQTIPVPPDPETLAAVAEQTGGRFFDAPDAGDLKGIYERVGSEVGTETKQEDVGWAFAAAGAALLVAGGALSAVWFGRIP